MIFIMEGIEMTLKHLKIFVTVFETLNFTHAGKLLFMAQPAVSLAIKELEEFYGVPLFDRIKHAVYPTAHGKKLYKYASKILAQVDEMNDSIKDWNMNTTIRIGSSITIGNNLLPQLVNQFQNLYPQIEIKVIVNNTKTIENYILENKIDFALIESDPSFEDITSIPFMQDHLCTISHHNHHLAFKKNISLEELTSESFLMREKGSSVRELVESIFLTNQIQITPSWESISTQALISAVEHNAGITTLPYHLIINRYDKNKIVQLDVPKLNVKRNYNIIFYKDKYLAKPIIDFFDLCKKIGKNL